MEEGGCGTGRGAALQAPRVSPDQLTQLNSVRHPQASTAKARPRARRVADAAHRTITGGQGQGRQAGSRRGAAAAGGSRRAPAAATHGASSRARRAGRGRSCLHEVLVRGEVGGHPNASGWVQVAPQQLLQHAGACSGVGGGAADRLLGGSLRSEWSPAVFLFLLLSYVSRSVSLLSQIRRWWVRHCRQCQAEREGGREGGL